MRRGDRGSVLATLLFTDIVGSTQLADQLGDRRWRELLARHHEIVRRELRQFQGREIDTAGDGFFAAFDRPADAVRCAAAICDAVRTLGIEVRAGLHVGEAEAFKRKLSGVAVHIAARVLALAGPGEVLVTAVLRDLVPGAGVRFEDRGLHALKGVPGEWRVFAVSAIDGKPPPPPLDPEASKERLDRIPAPRIPRRMRRPAAATAVVVVLVVGLAAFVVWGRNGPSTGSGAQSGPGTAAVPPKGQLALIDPVTRQESIALPLDFDPGPVAFAEGSVWIVDEKDDRIVRVDAMTHRVLASIRVGSDPEAIAAGAGSVWVANHFGRSVSRIDPGTDAVVATIPLDFLPLRVAAASGAVWAASNSIQQLVENQYARVSEIDPVVNRAAPPFKIYGSPCTPVLAAGSENGWIGTAFGRVFNLPSSGEAALFATVDAELDGIFVDAAGLIWFGTDGAAASVL